MNDSQTVLKKLLIWGIPDDFYASIREDNPRSVLYEALIHKQLSVLNRIFRVKEADNIQQIFRVVLEGYKVKHNRKDDMLEHLQQGFVSLQIPLNLVTRLYHGEIPMIIGCSCTELVSNTLKRFGDSIRATVNEHLGKPKHNGLKIFLDSAKERSKLYIDAVDPRYKTFRILGLWACNSLTTNKLSLKNANVSLSITDIDKLIKGTQMFHFNFIVVDKNEIGKVRARTLQLFDEYPVGIKLNGMEENIKANHKTLPPLSMQNPLIIHRPIDATHKIIKLATNYFGRKKFGKTIEEYSLPDKIILEVQSSPIKEGSYPSITEDSAVVLVASIALPVCEENIMESVPIYNFVPPKEDFESSVGGGEVEGDSTFVSFMCPITHDRISTPVRGLECIHIPCFDLYGYIQLASSTGLFNCPICQKPCAFSNLRIDSLMMNAMADRTHKSAYLSYRNRTFNFRDEEQMNEKGKSETDNFNWFESDDKSADG